MKFIHTSDWHLGRKLHNQELLDYQREFCKWLLATAQEQQAAAVVVAGDIYDRALPPVEAVQILDETVAAFAKSDVELILTPGNHDSAVRLSYGGKVMADSGVHLRTDVPGITQPVVLSDEHGDVGFYGIPYLLPDAVMAELEADRSHEAVLAAAAERIRADAGERGLERTVVMAHAFIKGGSAKAEESESERDISVGGIADASAAVFDGFNYTALGHLHGPQTVSLAESDTIVAYSGSPLAFSFSERNHTKSVALVKINGTGTVSVERLPIPVGRGMRQEKGNLEELLAQAADDPGDTRAWLKVILTDNVRPESPMERLRGVWHNTIALDFQPAGAAGETELAPLGRLERQNPTLVTKEFMEFHTGAEPDQVRSDLIDGVVTASGEEAK